MGGAAEAEEEEGEGGEEEGGFGSPGCSGASVGIEPFHGDAVGESTLMVHAVKLSMSVGNAMNAN